MAILRADGLGKAYRMYRRPFDSLKELLLRREYSETFWALRDVTFDLEEGTSLGIIGNNGAGKSTLLRLLAGALAPTTGRVERSGRVATLLTLGGGFHPDLSGADNIRIGCAVMGLSPDETDTLLPPIVDFSELGEFIDRPIRTYSSGMYLRLGFSVATAVNPDVLIVDEHLAVGDQHFRLKCKRRIMDLRAAGCAIVLCSHDLISVHEICNYALWLQNGRAVLYDDSVTVSKAYVEANTRREAEAPAATPAAGGRSMENCLETLRLGGDFRDGEIESGGTLKLHMTIRLTETAHHEGVNVSLLILRKDGLTCWGGYTTIAESASSLGEGRYGVTFVAEDLPLIIGDYDFTVVLRDFRSPHIYDVRRGACAFHVHQDGAHIGVTRMTHRWDPS